MATPRCLCRSWSPRVPWCRRWACRRRAAEGIRGSLQWILVLKCVKFSSVGARQCTRGCSSRGLGGVFALVQGLYMSPCLVALLGWPSRVFFSRHRHSFQPALAFLSAGLDVFRAGAVTQSPAEPSGRRALRVGVLVKHVEPHNRRLSIYSRVRPEPRCARSPEPRPA